MFLTVTICANHIFLQSQFSSCAVIHFFKTNWQLMHKVFSPSRASTTSSHTSKASTWKNWIQNFNALIFYRFFRERTYQRTYQKYPLENENLRHLHRLLLFLVHHVRHRHDAYPHYLTPEKFVFKISTDFFRGIVRISQYKYGWQVAL